MAFRNQELLEFSDIILNGVERMFKERDKRFDGVESRLEKIEGEMIFIKRDIRDIKDELNITPSRKEFSHLEEKVDRLATK